MTPTPENFGGAPHNGTWTPEKSGAATGDGAVNSKERAPMYWYCSKCQTTVERVPGALPFCACGGGLEPIQWIPVAQELPPEGEIVLTKIDDARGCRNEGQLERHGKFWFIPGPSIYVYYTPTHWARD